MINQQKIKEWVDIFLAHVEKITPEIHVEKEEGYKFKAVNTFQFQFDIAMPDPLQFFLNRAIEQNNLVAGSWYFPRKMLLIFAEEYPNETRTALNILFDESKPVVERINDAENRFSKLIETRNEKLKEKSHSFIGIRFLSLLLGYRYPERHNPLKPREWKVFCRFIDEDFSMPNRISNGEQYEIFTPYIEALRLYIKELPAIKELKDRLTSGLGFRDEEFRWMTQNVIYVTARVLANQRAETGSEEVKETDEEDTKADILSQVIISDSMEFPLEAYLEDFMVKNWGNIDFGEKLELFIDEDGTPGQQYTTDIGIIDILAKDKKGNFVIIELKRSKSDQKVIGQILSYISWVKDNLAKNSQSVRGIVIVGEASPALLSAQKMVSDMVKVKCYKVDLSIVEP